MNTNTLKKFARETRTKLISLVSAKLIYALSGQSAELRERREQISKLIGEIERTSREQVIEKVAYTWFNRFIALRFMDVNDYQPLGLKVLSPKDGYTLPELLDEAKNGNIPEDLRIDSEHLSGLLDGRIPSADPQNEVYKALLIGACNHLHQVLPFLFERINDFTELLLPDDLTSELSIVQDIRDGMSATDCQQVEIVGWLYQFYIAEKKDEVFASRAKVKKEDIPAATQLFTPRWIVEYMVQNTLGKLWLQNKPQSALRGHMPYLIDSPVLNGIDHLAVNSPEEIKLLDQACGSGHILVYAFELLTKIYEEEGYNQSEIATLIITKNLYGLEIDERAAQLAGMALLMKAREYQRRLFKRNPVPAPQIICYTDLKVTAEDTKSTLTKAGFEPSEALLHDLANMRQATNLGSLIVPHAAVSEIEGAKQAVAMLLRDSSDAFLNLQLNGISEALTQLAYLAARYHCVVDNPPYMGNGNMNAALSAFVKVNYPDSKADLMACFMEAGLQVLHPQGFLGMINQHSWMFLSSYEDLRKKLLEEVNIDTLLHLGPRTFPEIAGEVVQNAAFTLWKTFPKYEGVYIRLVDADRSELKRKLMLETIHHKNVGLLFTADQLIFSNVPGHPISYWVTPKMYALFEKNKLAEEYLWADGKNVTSNSERFLRFYWEIADAKHRIPGKNTEDGEFKWVRLSKGGEYRRWYGNLSSVIDWAPSTRAYYRKFPIARIIPEDQWYQEGISWTKISSNNLTAFRFLPEGATFDDSGLTVFFRPVNQKYKWFFLAILNSRIFEKVNQILNQTLNLLLKDVRSLPIVPADAEKIEQIGLLVRECIEIAKKDWAKYETGWDFKKNELLVHSGQDLEENFALYEQYWRNKFHRLHRLEEELNRQIIQHYQLADEISSEIPLEEITILKDEASVHGDSIEFNRQEAAIQLISYAVGCMFGRYSLDKEGLILADQGGSLEEYLRKIGKARGEASFLPDADNIIPLLDDEWFEDDVVSCFHGFLKAAFGESGFRKNLAFIEECLGKDLRKYFTRDFYADHIKRYKKRPIYWMFSSPKGSFNVLIYLHRYDQDTLNRILNDYLIAFRAKLHIRMEHLDQIRVSGSGLEQSRAEKEKDRLQLVLIELQEYERDTLRPLAIQRIAIDLDEGVLVNYNKFGRAVKEVRGLNDPATKKKVREFDWINAEEIR